MYKINFELLGTTDMLFSRKIEGALKKATPEQFQQEAMQKAHQNGVGCVIPADNLWKALIAGAGFTEIKHSKKGLGTWIKAMVRVASDMKLDPGQPDYIQKAWATNKYAGQIEVYRPAWKEGWKAKGSLLVLMDTLKAEDLHSAMVMAGIANGLGSWRAKYGRFEVVSWKAE